MKVKYLTDICRPKQWKTISSSNLLEEGYHIYGANGIIGFYNEYNHENPTVLITCRGATCGEIHICQTKSYINGNAMALDDLSPNVDIRYLYYYLKGYNFKNIISGSAQPQITRDGLKKMQFVYPPLQTQKKIVEVLDKAQGLIDARKQQIKLLNDLISSVFNNMFGDPVTNLREWRIKKISDFIKIDTKMVTDFEKYADFPHIGINNIEKDTGKLSNFNTVKEDNIISGKYLFTADHIIYSKIRPNLNKVALPNFNGLCSADSYPLLVDRNIANKIYVALILRSDFFLNEILKHSSRTNIPKINKLQLLSFKCILPPIQLQNKFAQIVQQIENQKQLMEQSLAEMEDNFNNLMQRAFKGELF